MKVAGLIQIPEIKIQRVTQPCFSIRQKLAASGIICAWTFEKVGRIIRLKSESNTCILYKYFATMAEIKILFDYYTSLAAAAAAAAVIYFKYLTGGHGGHLWMVPEGLLELLLWVIRGCGCGGGRRSAKF